MNLLVAKTDYSVVGYWASMHKITLKAKENIRVAIGIASN